MAGVAVWLIETGSVRVCRSIRHGGDSQCLCPVLLNSCRVGGIVVECGAELSGVAQSCRVRRRVVECGAELSSVAQSCLAWTVSAGT